MPRKDQVPGREAEIGKRVRIMREMRKCSRSYLASRCGVDGPTIIRVELGRVPLKYGLAVGICRQLQINPLWLATGHGDQFAGHIELFWPKEIGVEDNAIFSRVFDEQLASCFPPDFGKENKLTRVEKSTTLDAMLRDAILRALADRLTKIIFHIPNSELEAFAKAVVTAAESVKSDFPKEKWKTVLTRQAYLESQDLDAQTAFLERFNKDVDKDSPNRNITDMKSELEGIVASVRRLTKARGAKAKLAKYLRVPAPRLSEWLNGEHLPSGENALKLRQWVERQER